MSTGRNETQAYLIRIVPPVNTRNGDVGVSPVVRGGRKDSADAVLMAPAVHLDGVGRPLDETLAQERLARTVLAQDEQTYVPQSSGTRRCWGQADVIAQATDGRGARESQRR